MKCFALFMSLLLPLLGLEAAAQTEPAAALKVLHATNDKVQWNAKAAVVADVTCDGVPDTIVVGYETGSVWLGVVPGTKSPKAGKPMTTHFLLGKQTQDSFCDVPVRVEIYPIECENEDGSLPGCKAVKGCSAFSLIDDSCDSFHFYWDGSRKSLRWWRR
jgi:hypothetical protein